MPFIHLIHGILQLKRQIRCETKRQESESRDERSHFQNAMDESLFFSPSACRFWAEFSRVKRFNRRTFE